MKVLEVLETVFGTEIMILGDQFLMAAWQAFALDYDIFWVTAFVCGKDVVTVSNCHQ